MTKPQSIGQSKGHADDCYCFDCVVGGMGQVKMKSLTTPGPWKVRTNPKSSVHAFSIDGESRHGIGLDGLGLAHVNDAADAELIASAPELLRMLKDVIRELKAGDKTNPIAMGVEAVLRERGL